MEMVHDIFSDRVVDLQTQHFLVTIIMEVDIVKEEKGQRINKKKDLSALRNPEMRAGFDLLFGRILKKTWVLRALMEVMHCYAKRCILFRLWFSKVRRQHQVSHGFLLLRIG